MAAGLHRRAAKQQAVVPWTAWFASGAPSRWAPKRALTGAVLALLPVLALFALLPTAAAQGSTGAATRAVTAALEIPVDQVVVGDTGYALTAGPGNRIERFPIEVLGVQHDGGNGFPLVLVRASGPFIERTGGVAAGMSGSPVYVRTERGDALLGAIGYVFPNADHQIALVTPIADMRSADRTSSVGPVEVPGYGVALPVATPVLLSGAGPRAAAMLAPLFRDASVTPLPVQVSGTAPASADADYRLAPGSAIAVALVSGDVQMSAVGTVTAVSGDRLLAFGHPFLGTGAVQLPFVPAFVTAIVSSSEVPFKLANVGRRVLGTIEQDRPTALAGRVDGGPPTIEVSLSLLGLPGEPRFEYEVAADERLYPVLIATGALQLLDRALGATDGGSAELAWEIGLTGGQRVNVLEQVSHPSDIALAAAQLAGGPLLVLADNRYGSADVERVSINVRLDERQRVASLEEAVLEASTVTAGDAAHVHLRLQPHRERAVVRTVTVPLPFDLEGVVTLLIRGGGVPRNTGDLDLDEQEIDAPRTFGELLEALRHRVRSNELIVEAVTEDGELLRLLRSPFPFVVEGHERVELTVVAASGGEPGDGDARPGADELDAQEEDDATGEAGDGAADEDPEGAGGERDATE